MSGELIKKQISKRNAGECKDVTTFVDDVASCHVSERKAKTRRGRVRCPASYQETFSPYVKSCNVFFLGNLPLLALRGLEYHHSVRSQTIS